MSTGIATEADFAFFDELALHRWPNKTKEQRDVYRELVETGEIQIETLLENTLAIQSQGMYERVCQNEFDFSDRSDAKKTVSSARTNQQAKNKFKVSFKISGVKNKIGLIRAMCYSILQKKFYYFAIPHFAYKDKKDSIEVSLDNIKNDSISTKSAQGIPQGEWARYLVADFKTLATIKDDEATINADNNAEATLNLKLPTPSRKKITVKATEQSFKSLFG